MADGQKEWYEREVSAVELVNDLFTSESTRRAIQNLFLAASGKGKDKREQWVDLLMMMEGEEAAKAKQSLLSLVSFLQCARGTQEAEDFLDCLMSIGGMRQLEGAETIFMAIQDQQVHDAFEEFALALGQGGNAPDRARLERAIDTIERVFSVYMGSQDAADSIAKQLAPLNQEGSMLADMLHKMEENFDATGEDLIKVATRDPLNFSQKLIRRVIWPVLSERLNRIEVPNLREETSKNLYVIEDIVVHVTSFPKSIKLEMTSVLELQIDGKDIRNGGTEMVCTIACNGIAAKSDVMKFEVEKRSWPSFADKGDFEVHIDEPGFDLAIGIVVVQPADDEPSIFDAGDVQCTLRSFRIQFHKNVKNEWLLNTAGRWFNSVLKTAIANAVSNTLKNLMSDGFKTFSKLLAAQQALVKKVQERQEEERARRASSVQATELSMATLSVAE